MPVHSINFSSNKPSNSDTYSDFEVQFKPAIAVPPEHECTLEVEQALIWWAVENVTSSNNVFTYSDGGASNNITIPTGLYDLEQLITSMKVAFENKGLSAPFPFIIADKPSGSKVVIEFRDSNVTVDFSAANNMRELLGFNSGVLSVSGNVKYSIAPNEGQFSAIDSFHIHCDLVKYGIQTNNDTNQTIAHVPINVKPNYLVIYQPSNPVVLDCSHLSGENRGQVRLWLTDQNNNLVNTKENWSFRIKLTMTPKPKL